MTAIAAPRLLPMERFIVPLDAAGAADATRVGPKAASLAALARAGLPTPGGFCLTADAYLAQIAARGLEDFRFPRGRCGAWRMVARIIPLKSIAALAGTSLVA